VRHLPHSTEQQNSSRAPIVAPEGGTTRAVGRRRFNRGVGFWLGGVVLGFGGGLFGAYMPYHQPVAVLVSVLWWGLYLGCLGTSLGALVGLWAEQGPALPSQDGEGVGKPPAEATCPTALADNGGFVNGVKRATSGNPGRRPMSGRASVPGR
jgi:hypothetical protein